MNEQLTLLTTESQNEQTMKIDTASTKEILNVMNKEDQKWRWLCKRYFQT